VSGRIDRRGACAGLLAALFAAAGARAQDPADPAVELVNGLYDGVRLAAAAGPVPVATRLDLLGDALTRTFDYPVMMRLAYGGTRWGRLPAERQGRLIETFTRFFNTVYANRLSAAAGSTFEVQPTSEARGEGRLVKSRVMDPGGNATNVDYVVGKSGRVTDVLLAGVVSEVGNLRTEFEGPVKSGGADALEAHMRARVEAMLAPKPGG
jgi:phospholipid transport system substrate-binding protein